MKSDNGTGLKECLQQLAKLSALMGALIAHGQASAVCLNPFGCGPKNYDECRLDATAKPTEVGVRLAMTRCYDLFKKPEEDRKAAEAKEAAERFASAWAAVNYDTSIADMKRRLGEPTMLHDSACAKRDDGPKPPRKCTTYLWKDPRPGRICMDNLSDLNCYFRVQAEGDSRSNKIWALWTESK